MNKAKDWPISFEVHISSIHCHDHFATYQVKVETARVKWASFINYIFVGNQRTRRVSMMRLKKDMMPWQYPKVNKRILHIYMTYII